jgi:hypothetical protein
MSTENRATAKDPVPKKLLLVVPTFTTFSVSTNDGSWERGRSIRNELFELARVKSGRHVSLNTGGS